MRPTRKPPSRPPRRRFAIGAACRRSSAPRCCARSREVLRQNGDELAMIDAADCGNPYTEMVRDAQMRRGAARFLRRPRHRDEGRLDPDGPRRGEFLGARALRRGRPHHSVQPSLHVRGRQVGGAARRRQHRRAQAAGAGAAVGAAAGRADRRHPAAGRVERGAGRQGGRAGARQPSRRRHGGADRQRADRARRDEGGGRHPQAGAARARRQERADRLSGRRSRRRRGGGGRRHEFHLVRPELRLDQPRLRACDDLRRRAGARAAIDQALPARRPDRSRHHHGGDHQPGAARPHHGLHRGRQAGGRAARLRRRPSERSQARQAACSSSPPSSPT